MAYDKPIGVITVAAEASSEPHLGRVAVAAVILNRVRDGRFGHTAAAVCLKRMQFSEWDADRADNADLERVASMADDDSVIVDCAAAWDEAISGNDPTGAATHFYSEPHPAPPWTVGATFTVQIGRNLFFKDVK
jgi:spore germination cell wall hydrolase CwlJ-like protein